MSDNNKVPVIIGAVLIGIGAFFLATQFIPGLTITTFWPLFVLGTGLIFFTIGLIKVHGLVIPGSILCYVGSVLLFKNVTNTWDIWQLWLLVPSSVGVGVFLNELLDKKDFNSAIRASWFLMLLGAVLFIIFMFPGNWGRMWPVIIIVVGVMILIQSLFSKKKKDKDDNTIDQ